LFLGGTALISGLHKLMKVKVSCFLSSSFFGNKCEDGHTQIQAFRGSKKKSIIVGKK
jgi:translation initiation factor IF-1